MLTRHILQTDEPGIMFTESVLTGRLQRHETVRALWKRSGPFFQSALAEAGEKVLGYEEEQQLECFRDSTIVLEPLCNG